jgi:hypothetical protein
MESMTQGRAEWIPMPEPESGGVSILARAHRPGLEFLSGGGELGALMRAKDWTNTSLGPVEHWPRSLRTSVSTCLQCAFPILVWWGPQLAMLYNDEYAQVIGPEKHPAALGAPGAEVWPEIWHIIGPMLSGVLTRGEATRSRDLLLNVARHGYPEEAYFSFSYSPIHDDTGAVGGVFCPVIETTQRVIGERRLRTLRDLAASCKGAENEARAYHSAAAVLAANSQDVPFALIYRIDLAQSLAVLEATAGIAAGMPAAPDQVVLSASADDP